LVTDVGFGAFHDEAPALVVAEPHDERSALQLYIVIYRERERERNMYKHMSDRLWSYI